MNREVLPPPPLQPEVLPPESKVDPLVEQLAWLMDEAIPLGRRHRIGLAGIIGLVPAAGDVAAALVSGFIVLRAARSGVPGSALARMLVNIALETVVGTIPLFGDAFAFAYKANRRNVGIYRETLAGTRNHRQDKIFVALVLFALAAIVALPILLLLFLLVALHRGLL